MSIPLSSNFNLVTQLPLDARFMMADTTARDAIPSIQRHEGLLVYTIADGKTWQLRGGITNSDWVDLIGSGTVTLPVDDEGTEVIAAISRLNFVGPGVTVTDGGAGEAIITIPGGGGSGDVDPTIYGACDDPLPVDVTGLLEADGHLDRESTDLFTFVEGDGGPINVTANPQIEDHDFIGAMLTIIGKSDTNTLTLEDGNGLKLNGTAVLGENDVLRLMWRGDIWIERRRSF